MTGATESDVTMHHVRHGQRILKRRGIGVLQHEARYRRIDRIVRTVNTAFYKRVVPTRAYRRVYYRLVALCGNGCSSQQVTPFSGLQLDDRW
jgi:hypothetical protein